MTIRIGISGWTYPPWRGVFYPEGLPQKDEMAYAANTFPTIEVNGTFYGLQKPTSFRRWRDGTPPDFVFSIKGSRYITHILRLRNARKALANFLASGLLALGPKLGPILWQLPPSLRFDPDALESFLAMLPGDFRSAAKLAATHDRPIRGGAFLRVEENLPLRHALEIRHESFRDDRFIALLRRYGIAIVVADTVEWPCLQDITADFIYARLHGSEELYASGYSDEALDNWARKFRAWSKGGEPRGAKRVSGKAPAKLLGRPRDVFIYFDNDIKVRAPFDALGLASRLRVPAGQPPAEDWVREPARTRRTAGRKAPSRRNPWKSPEAAQSRNP